MISISGLNALNHTIQINAGSGTCSTNEELKKYNYWLGPANGDWHSSSSNWSLNEIPDFCDDVLIPPDNEITISSGISGNARSIEIQGNSNLLVVNGSRLEIRK